METIVLSLLNINHKDLPFYNLCIEKDIKKYLIIGRKSATNTIASSFFTIENLEHERKTTCSRQVKILHRHVKVDVTKD